MHGVSKTFQSDNGHSRGRRNSTLTQSQNLLKTRDKHKTITPRRLKAQGKVDNFNKLVNKTIRISRHNHIDPEEETPYQWLMTQNSSHL